MGQALKSVAHCRSKGGSWYSGDLRLKSARKQGNKALAWLGCLEKSLEGKPVWVPRRMQWG